MKASTITVTDMFCGAGGSSTGAVQAGADVALAINHWQRAIETHNTNHPTTTHVLTDITRADPWRYPSTTILLASPECTNHTLAKGKQRKGLGLSTLFGENRYDPAEERSRCTMWDPLRWTERHHYEVVILENVVDARFWVMWDAWVLAWKNLGYELEMVYLNSMFAHPTPQSRDRLYVVAWKKGNRKPDLAIKPLASCFHCQRDVNAIQSWKNPLKRAGKYRQQYVYCCPHCAREVTPHFYPAASAIDWTQPIQRINERKHPLKERTMERIGEGLKKFAGNPFSIPMTRVQDRLRDITQDPFPTQTATEMQALVTPLLMGLNHQRTQVSSTNAPWPAQTTSDGTALGAPAYLMSYYNKGAFEPLSQPVPTVTTLDRCALVTQETPHIEECGFRMLESHEIQAAMAFPREYVVTGTHREKVKQLGNAVTPPVMHLLVGRCVASLAQKSEVRAVSSDVPLPGACYDLPGKRL